MQKRTKVPMATLIEKSIMGSEVQSIIIMVRYGTMQADMALEKLRALHLDPQATNATVCHIGHSLSI